MAKPKRTQQRPGATGGQRPPTRQPGASTNGATANGARTVPTSTSNGSSIGADRATSASGTAKTAAMRGTAGSDAMRQRVQARRNQRRYEVKRSPWQGPMPVIGAVVGVLIIIVIIFAIANSQNGKKTVANPVPTNVLTALQKPSTDILNQVGAGTTYPNIMKALPNTSGTDLPTQNGKPVLMYVGAEYCPYCAADRWSLITALSRFGTFSNLHTMSSASNDVYPSTPTFTFLNSTYTSQYLAFDAKETEDQNQQPLQTLTAAENKVFGTYDVPPYDSLQGGIPFIDFGGQYMTSGGSYDVGVLHTTPSDQNSSPLSYNQIVSALGNATDPITQGIYGTANQYTAAICKMTNDSDKAVCSTSTIQQLESKLPQR